MLIIIPSIKKQTNKQQEPQKEELMLRGEDLPTEKPFSWTWNRSEVWSDSNSQFIPRLYWLPSLAISEMTVRNPNAVVLKVENTSKKTNGTELKAPNVSSDSLMIYV